MTEKTQNESDLNKRIEECNKEVRPILKKYELDIAGEPFITQGFVVAKPVYVSTRKEETNPKEDKLNNPEA